MKSFVVILALLFCVSCTETSKTENINSSLSEKPINNAALSSTSEIMLEVTSQFDGRLGYIKGNVLNFRLYTDGFAEFDDCPTESTTGKQIIAEESCNRNRVKINESELKETREILASNEFRKLKKKYEKIGSSCDSAPTVKVKTKSKIIEIMWCDSLTQPKLSPEFPEILVKLLQLNRQIRNQILGKEVNSLI